MEKKNTNHWYKEHVRGGDKGDFSGRRIIKGKLLDIGCKTDNYTQDDSVEKVFFVIDFDEN